MIFKSTIASNSSLAKPKSVNSKTIGKARAGNKRSRLFRLSDDHPFVLVNLIILISTIIITIIDFIHGTDGGQRGFLVQGWNYFMPFTINSNILMAIAALIALIKLIRHPNGYRFGRKFTNYYYMATVSLNLTAATVALFLAPLQFTKGENGLMMFANDMFFFHLVNPALAVYLLLYLFKGMEMNKMSRLLCFIPPMCYSMVYSIHVLILRDWSDFYNYTFNGNWFLTILSASINSAAIYLVASLFMNAYNKRVIGDTTPEIILP